MKPVRLVFIGAATIVVLLLIAAAVLFNSSFQTWAVRKVLAQSPEWRTTVGSVDVGWSRVELKDVRVAQDGGTVSVPLVEVDLPVLAAVLRDRVSISRLVAKGWSVDLSGSTAGAASAEAVADPAEAVARAFAGVFSLLDLPVDLSVNGVQLEGDVVLPETRGRAKVVINGGKLGAGGEGTFEFLGDATLADPKINTLSVRGTLHAAMRTPRSFERVTAKIEASARGAQVPNGVMLASDLSAARTAAGEEYAITVTAANRQLLALAATLPAGGQQIEGTWKLDVQDADLAPFALGHALPVFSALGEGRFDADVTFNSVHGEGRLDATADRLEVLRPELGAVGQVRLAAEFDLAQRGTRTVVDHLNAALRSREAPVLAVRSLQAFSLDLDTRALTAADVARELFALELQGLPLAWVQPFLPGIEIDGGDIHGEFVATTRSGGVHVRSTAPLGASGVSVAQGGASWLNDVDLTLRAAADYAPQGWQAEVAELALTSADASLLTMDLKAGQLAGAGQPVKATGNVRTQLGVLARQPIARLAQVLTAGEGTIDFAASLGVTREIQASIEVRGLAANPEAAIGTLPQFSTALRADISPTGTIALNLPIQLEAAGRKSDVTIAGMVKPAKDVVTIEAQVTSNNLIVDDAKSLAALISAGAGPESSSTTETATAGAPRDVAPPWAGLDGTLALALKRVVYSGSFEATDVNGTLRIVDGALKLEGMRTGFGERGSAKLDGTVAFDAKLAQPYALAAGLMMQDYDPGPLFRALDPKQPPMVEGNFQIEGRINGRAATLTDLPANAAGDFQLTSHGGVFRGLPVNVASIVENTGTIAALIASAGNALSEITGRRDSSEIVSKAQAVSELAKRLNAISYDQLNLSITRGPSLDVAIKEFTLISPELRLSGRGGTTHQAGASLWDDRLMLEFNLRARGQVANLLRRIGRLSEETDELGYAACTLPLKVNGTLSRPQTGELNRTLVAIALEKTGVADKAADLIDRIRGR